jgi:hypothetical protein
MHDSIVFLQDKAMCTPGLETSQAQRTTNRDTLKSNPVSYQYAMVAALVLDACKAFAFYDLVCLSYLW